MTAPVYGVSSSPVLMETVDNLNAEILRLRRILREINEIVDDSIDIDNNGGPNLAMRVSIAVKEALNL